ncbi:MAG: hypothetical protein AAF358_01020 [Pseudomonadota bacterium]
MTDLSREVRGGRKAFYDDPDVDRLLAIVTRLLEEHWALRERHTALEKLLVEKQLLEDEDIESYEFAEADSAVLDAASAKLIRDVLGAARNIES